MNRCHSVGRGLCCLLLVAAVFRPSAAGAEERAAWMKEARWGVMTHYLADWIAGAEGGDKAPSVDWWNDLIDQFDVERLAGELESVGAGYLILTIGQNSGFYLAPNATYDRYVGIA